MAAKETVRLVYHARTLLVAGTGMVFIVLAIALAGGNIGQAELGGYALPLLAATFAVLSFITWLGWIDYASATGLKIDARGVTMGGRLIAWTAIRRVSRATGSFRITLTTDAGKVRFQLLVLARPIDSLKLLVAEAGKGGAQVDSYLVRLADHVEEESESDTPDP